MTMPGEWVGSVAHKGEPWEARICRNEQSSHLRPRFALRLSLGGPRRSAWFDRWWCLPRFDSPSVFARILDENAGHFLHQTARDGGGDSTVPLRLPRPDYHLCDTYGSCRDDRCPGSSGRSAWSRPWSGFPSCSAAGCEVYRGRGGPGYRVCAPAGVRTHVSLASCGRGRSDRPGRCSNALLVRPHFAPGREAHRTGQDRIGGRRGSVFRGDIRIELGSTPGQVGPLPNRPSHRGHGSSLAVVAGNPSELRRPIRGCGHS